MGRGGLICESGAGRVERLYDSVRRMWTGDDVESYSDRNRHLLLSGSNGSVYVMLNVYS